MRICGVDPGLQITGYGVVEVSPDGTRVIDAGIIRTDGRANLNVQLGQIHGDLCAVLDEHRPDVLAVENVYSHYNHPQTAVLMGHARGVVLLAAAQRRISVSHFAATAIKRALTGNGRASKSQMQQAIKISLRLVVCPQPHDVADALAVALCGASRAERGRLTQCSKRRCGVKST